MPSLPQKAKQCPNCAQALHGEAYCPNCGQKNDVRRITLWHFIGESLSNFFAIDGRFFHTFRKLFSAPGKVPKDFIHGKRNRYMNPVRVYFLASLLLLFVLQIDGGDATMIQVGEEKASTEKLDFTLKKKEKAPISLSFTESDSAHSGPDTAQTAKRLSNFERMINYGSQHPAVESQQALNAMGIESSFWHRFLYEQAKKVGNFDDEEFSRIFYSKIFWVLFLFLPVLGLLLHLLYVRRNFYYPEHLFFACYTQAVLFILISLGYLLNYWVNNPLPMALCMLIFGGYLLLALKKFYQQSWRKTTLKFIIYNLLSVPVFVLFFIAAALVVFIFI